MFVSGYEYNAVSKLHYLRYFFHNNLFEKAMSEIITTYYSAREEKEIVHERESRPPIDPLKIEQTLKYLFYSTVIYSSYILYVVLGFIGQMNTECVKQLKAYRVKNRSRCLE